MNDQDHHGRGLFFVGFVLALVPGVTLALWGIRKFASYSISFAFAIWMGLLVFGAASALFVFYGRRIFARFGLRFAERLSATVAPLIAAVGKSISGDHGGVREAAEDAGRTIASWYSGVVLRSWIVRGTVALFAVLGSLLGIALLERQNTLLEMQNQFFRQQIRQQEIQDYHERRAELIRTIFDERECRSGEIPLRDHSGCPMSSIESRVAAVLALWEIETAARESPERSAYLHVPKATNLRGADLRGGSFVGVELRGIDLSGAHLEGAILSTVDLSDADLSYATLGVDSPMEGTPTVLEKVVLRDANLHGANLKWVNVDADLERASLQYTHLEGADLTMAKHLEMAEVVEIKCCPVNAPRGTIWPGSGPNRGYTPPACAIFSSCYEQIPYFDAVWDEIIGERTVYYDFGGTTRLGPM